MFTVPTQPFKQAVAACLPLAPPGRAYRAAGKLLVALSPGHVEVYASDFHSTLRAQGPCQGAGEWTALVDARALRDAILHAKDPTITLTPGAGGIAVACGGAGTGLDAVTDTSEYPLEPAFPTEPALTLQAQELRTALRRVAFAAAETELRAILERVCLQVTDGMLRLAATDGNQLACYGVPVRHPDTAPLLVHRRFARQLAKLLPKRGLVQLGAATTGNPRVGLDFELDQLSLRAQTAHFTGGTFPSYGHMVPASVDTTVTIDALPLRDAVEAAFTVSKDVAGSVRFIATTGSLNVSAEDSQAGRQFSADLPCGVAGPDGFVGLCGAYVLEYLRSLPRTARVELGIRQPHEATLWRLPGESEAFWLCMPVFIAHWGPFGTVPEPPPEIAAALKAAEESLTEVSA